jgi:CRISPR/Cas system CSM-associated protein Csm3 (group 7 of RAMP superfamily)
MRVSIQVLNSLHVGWTQFRLDVPEDRIRCIVRSERGDLLSAVEEISQLLRLDYQPFCKCLNIPVIPGSTVKGNVRARIELSFRPRNGQVKSCFVEAGRIDEKQQWRHIGIWGKREKRIVPGRRGKKLAGQCHFDPQRDELQRVCLVCDLFGTTGLASLIRFSDFVGRGTELKEENFEFGLRLETAPANSVFCGKIYFFNLKPEELGLLLLGMGIESGVDGRPVLMGRLKYRDYNRIGQVKYRLDRLELSPLSKELTIEPRLSPGQGLEGEKLGVVATNLVKVAREKFGEELQPVDELEELKKITSRR